MAHPRIVRFDSHDDELTDTDTQRSGTLKRPLGSVKPAGGNGEYPTLFHKVQNQKSILALVVSDSKIFAGTQGGEIVVWSLGTYELLSTVLAHNGAVLSLFVSSDGKLLFSSAGDAIVNVWCTQRLTREYSIYSTYDVGDVFCVVYSQALDTVYLGAQNTSIQWYDLSRKDTRPLPNLASHPFKRHNRFFDSKGPGGVSTPRPTLGETLAQGGRDLEIDKEHIIQYAHYGYVYCMLLAKGLPYGEVGEEILISGGGDGSIKLWLLRDGMVKELATLENGDNSILAMALDDTFLYSGRLDGDADIWDLETRQLIRTIKAHNADVLTLAVGNGYILTGGSNGFAKKFNRRHECTSRWKAHDRLILASVFTTYNGKAIFVTGGNDDCVALWDIGTSTDQLAKTSKTSNEELLETLRKFVSLRTVSSKPDYAEECRRGASWLRGLFKKFGAITEMLTTDEHTNPVVFARFRGKPNSNVSGKRILFYGHYDVVAADNATGTWRTDPFDMQGQNGYLYGRGVTDNKGPVLAALYAVADLLAEQSLESDIVFLIEGEEECGSRGFQAAINRNKNLIGDIDWILLANSYWLNDDFPCLTYGLRGVIHATIDIKSEHPDLHSGVDGSHLLHEPLKDLVFLLGKLAEANGRVQIPGFYKKVLPITATEEMRYDAISRTLLEQNPELGDAYTLTSSLKARWREPSLTIHGFKTSGPSNSTIIPQAASAAVSLRLVPNQEVTVMQKSLVEYLEHQFNAQNSSNQINITINHQAEPWLGDPENEIFKTLERAVMDVWGPIGRSRRRSTRSSGTAFINGSNGPRLQPATSSTLTSGSNHSSQAVKDDIDSSDASSPELTPTSVCRKPLYIREGGSISAIRFLEKAFDAPAAHLPCGQASDSAHLDNERLRVSNIYKSREIFKKVFKELPMK